jgi:hypothetical protein
MIEQAGSGRGARYTWSLFRTALEFGHVLSLPVNGYCMWPVLKPGDRVRVRRLEHGQVCIGDVLLCVHGHRAVVHRAASLGFDSTGEPIVRCRGDASRRLDAEVRLQDVCGVVVGVERGNQWVPLTDSRGLVSIVFGRLRSALILLRAWRGFRR